MNATAVSIMQCGLDHHKRDIADSSIQESVMRAQLRLAKELHRPCSVIMPFLSQLRLFEQAISQAVSTSCFVRSSRQFTPLPLCFAGPLCAGLWESFNHAS